MKETSIVFTGDIGFDKYMTGKWTDENLLSGDIQTFFDTADHVAANVEGALLDPASGSNTDGGDKGMFFHTMDPAATCFLDRIHADIWCFANNHTMDAGWPGLESTLALAKAHGAMTVGSGKTIQEAAAPAILPEAGGIGILGVGYEPTCIAATETAPGCVNWNDYDCIEKTVREIKARCRWCILVSHGGEEFDSMPLPYVRDRYLRYLELGADIVVGHHPHVPQNYETFADGKAIFYSLGNFIFDTDYQRAQFNTDIGILLKLYFTEDSFRFEPLCTKLTRGAEQLSKGELPGIFRDVNAQDFEKLAPLAARAFAASEIRRQLFLHPEKYAEDREEAFRNYWQSFLPGSHRKNEHMDLPYIRSLADQPDTSSGCDPDVIAYLTRQL